MSDGPKGQRCDWCGRIFLPKQGPGRPRRFCKQGCRQSHYIANKLAAAHGLDAEHAVVSRAGLDELLDARFQLELAMADIDRAFTDADADAVDHARWLAWLREHVQRLLIVGIEPAGVPNS